MNELPHERIAKKMRELGGVWTPSRYNLLAKEMGIRVSLDDVMSLCAPQQGFVEIRTQSNIWTIPTRR